MTFHEEVDEVTGLSRKIVVDSPDEKKQPLIEIRDKAGKVTRKYHMPSHAHLMVEDGELVYAGQVLAKIPRETTKTKDITGGLPRVVELFEARKPRETAVISEIDGLVRHGGIVKGQRKIIIVPEDGGEPREYSLPRGVHVNVQEGDRVRAGEPLMDGPSNPHDILSVLGEKALHAYLVNEIQEVYRLQGVNINDKHIEVIVRQMMRWVKIEEVGDTEFLIEEQVDRFRFMEENERVIANGGRPATGRPLLLGITKASLSTDSFISAASFQETTRVLTEASISGKVDHLRGLKENVTMGRLIPAGTGFEYYRQCGSRRTNRRRHRHRRPRSWSSIGRWSTSWSRKRRLHATKSSNWRLGIGNCRLVDWRLADCGLVDCGLGVACVERPSPCLSCGLIAVSLRDLSDRRRCIWSRVPLPLPSRVLQIDISGSLNPRPLNPLASAIAVVITRSTSP